MTRILETQTQAIRLSFLDKGATPGTQTSANDATKELAEVGIWTWVYDPEGAKRLARYDCIYDADEHRLSITVTITGMTTTTRFGYDAVNVWADLDGRNNLVTRREYLDGTDSVFPCDSTGGTAAWYLPDRQGSIRMLTDNTGSVIDTVAYSWFGVVTSESTPANGDAYKYAGYQFDSGTNLDYVWHRYLDPVTMRWTGQDPMGFGAGDENLYRYVGNMSPDAIDPSGLEEIRWGPSVKSLTLGKEEKQLRDNVNFEFIGGEGNTSHGTVRMYYDTLITGTENNLSASWWNPQPPRVLTAKKAVHFKFTTNDNDINDYEWIQFHTEFLLDSAKNNLPWVSKTVSGGGGPPTYSRTGIRYVDTERSNVFYSRSSAHLRRSALPVTMWGGASLDMFDSPKIVYKIPGNTTNELGSYSPLLTNDAIKAIYDKAVETRADFETYLVYKGKLLYYVKWRVSSKKIAPGDWTDASFSYLSSGVITTTNMPDWVHEEQLLARPRYDDKKKYDTFHFPNPVYIEDPNRITGRYRFEGKD